MIKFWSTIETRMDENETKGKSRRDLPELAPSFQRLATCVRCNSHLDSKWQAKLEGKPQKVETALDHAKTVGKVVQKITDNLLMQR